MDQDFDTCPQCKGEIDEPERCVIRNDILFCCEDCANDYWAVY